MISVLERLGRRKNPITAKAPTETPPEPEQKEKPYPTTITGVMHRLRDASVTASRDELAQETARAVEKLSDIAKAGVSNFKRWAKDSGREWEGRLSFGPLFPREQDGLYSYHSEGVEIRKNDLLLFSGGSESCGDVRHEDEVELVVSKDCSIIKSARYTRTKTFDKEKVILEAIEMRFKNSQLVEIKSREMKGEAPYGDGSFYIRPQGPLQELKVKVLPSKPAS